MTISITIDERFYFRILIRSFTPDPTPRRGFFFFDFFFFSVENTGVSRAGSARKRQRKSRPGRRALTPNRRPCESAQGVNAEPQTRRISAVYTRAVNGCERNERATRSD